MKLVDTKAVGSLMKSGFDSLKKFAKKNSHIITGCIGVASVIGTGVFAYTARPKVDRILYEAKEQIELLNEEADKCQMTEEEYKKRLRHINFVTARKIVSALGPAVIAGTTASGVVIFTTDQVIKTGKKLADARALQATTELMYSELYDKTKDALGEEEAKKIQHEVDQELINKQFGKDISDETVEEIFEVALQARGGNQLYYDPQFGMLFKSDDDTLNRATDELIGDLRRRKDPEQYISYNKWLSQIDLPGVGAGEDYAVAWYDQAYLQFSYTSELDITGLELNLNNTVKIGKRAVTVLHWRDKPIWTKDLQPRRH